MIGALKGRHKITDWIETCNSVARSAGLEFLGGTDPRVTLAALAHPGLPSVAASRLVDANIDIDAMPSSASNIIAAQSYFGFT